MSEEVQETPEVVTKNWKSVGVFKSYEKALEKKNSILEKHSLVKIRRCGRGGNEFRVKYWDEAPQKKKKKK